jgi:hypothetical protein
MRPIPRILGAMLMATLAVALTTMGAAATGKPDRQPAPTPPDVLTEVCGPAVGPVLAHITTNRQHITTFTNSDGSLRISFNGASVSSFTRVANGKTVSVNASGPATLIFRSDGTASFVSRGLLVAIESDGIWQFAGRVVVDPETFEITSHSGRVTSICAMLA